MASTFMLASRKASTYPHGKRACLGRRGRAGKNMTPRFKTLPAHQLAGVRKLDALYSSRRAPRYGLAGNYVEHPLEPKI